MPESDEVSSTYSVALMMMRNTAEQLAEIHTSIRELKLQVDIQQRRSDEVAKQVERFVRSDEAWRSRVDSGLDSVRGKLDEAAKKVASHEGPVRTLTDTVAGGKLLTKISITLAGVGAAGYGIIHFLWEVIEWAQHLRGPKP